MTHEFPALRHRRVLISDFDGTITKHDFYERVLEAYPNGPGQREWQRYRAGEITQFEVLRSIFALVPGDESQVMRLAHTTEMDPDFAHTVQQLDQRGWSVVIVSTGCQWYINRLLNEAGVKIPVIANPGELSADGGLRMWLPENSPYFSRETGIDKGAVTQQALSRLEQVAFAGNAQADLVAARLVRSELRFATDWLADRLSRDGDQFHRFEHWSEIASQLR